MTTSQDAFERSYSEFTGHPVEFIKLARLGNDSYSAPRIATAYTWWKRARADVVVLPVAGPNDSREVYQTIEDCREAIEAVGIPVAP